MFLNLIYPGKKKFALAQKLHAESLFSQLHCSVIQMTLISVPFIGGNSISHKSYSGCTYFGMSVSIPIF